MIYIIIVFFTILIYLSKQFKENYSKYITKNNYTDGYGSQMARSLGAWVCAKKNQDKYKYVHKEFKENYRSRVNKNLNYKKLNKFFNLGYNEILEEEIDEEKLNDYSKIKDCKNINIEVSDNRKLKTKLIEKYNKTHTPKLEHFNKGYNIAIHIRRGDVTVSSPYNKFDKKKFKSRFIPNYIYVKLINILRKKYQDKNPIFHIFSEGKKEDFLDIEKINKNDILFHINSSFEETFHSFVKADILIKARSTFSENASYYRLDNTFELKDFL